MLRAMKSEEIGKTGRLCIIPARGGSKRIPKKNVVLFEGVPMLVRAIRIAREVGRFDDVLVSTDNEEIAELASAFGARVPFLRSAETSNDFATTFDVVHEVLDSLEQAGEVWKVGVVIYPTAALAKPRHIRDAIDQIESDGLTSVMPVTRFDYSVWRAISVGEHGEVSFVFPEMAKARSQDTLPTFHDAGQWYAFGIGYLRSHREFLTQDTRAVVLNSMEVQDIDTEEDLALASIKHQLQVGKEQPKMFTKDPWIFFRVDASLQKGSGHVMRCISLADAFADRGYDVVFASASRPEKLTEIIEARGFKSVLLENLPFTDSSTSIIDAGRCIEWVGKQKSLPSWIILDDYELDISWEKALRCLGAPLLVIDDLATRPHDCDVFLDQNMITEYHDQYPKTVSSAAHLLLGGKYALLRKEFNNARERRIQRLSNGQANDVLIFLGGADSENLTKVLLEGVLGLVSHDHLLVLIGALNNQREEIEAYCRDKNIRCLGNIDDVAEVFANCRLLIGACGMMAVEAQSIGIPSILIPLSDIQKEVAEFFVKEKLGIMLDPIDLISPTRVKEAWQSALALPTIVSSPRGPSLDGAKNVVGALLGVTRDQKFGRPLP